MKNLNNNSTTAHENKEPIPISKYKPEKKSFFNSIKFIFAILFVIVVLLLLGGYYVYSVPFTSVVVDANTSINLKLNRWDKVVDVSALDNNGIKLINDANLKYKDVDDALIIIINKAEANDFIKLSSKDKKNYPVTIYVSGNSLNIPKFYVEAKTKSYDVQINENGAVKFNNFH